MRCPVFIAMQSRHPHGLLGALLARVMPNETAADNKQVIALPSPRESDHVLDAGTGHGRPLGVIAGLAPGGLTVGVDGSEVALNIARQSHARPIRTGRVRAGFKVCRSQQSGHRRAWNLALCAVLWCTPLAGAADWEHVGGDAGGRRHSSAAQITRENAASLKVAWAYSTGDLKRYGDARRWKFQATPILFDGRLTFCTPFNDVVALDPGSGLELWRFNAAIADVELTGNGYACRGVTAWRDRDAAEGSPCATRIFTGTNDDRLIALDAATGKRCSSFGNAGEIQIDRGRPQPLFAGEIQITSPPVVARGVVLVGSAIGDNGRVEAPSGAVHAFDARTGAPRWSFDPIPRDPRDPARKTWHGDAADRTGHANVWSLMSADEERGLFFIPTSSPSVDHYGGTRPGENRYANSVVALEAASGKVAWHFQTVHHDLWDYDVSAQPSLVTLKRGDRDVDALVQPTKMGLIFTFERATGTPLFEIHERPVPKGDVPGEWYSPTQPFPVAPRMLVPDRLTPDDAWGVTFLDRWACSDLIASTRYEGIFTPPSLQGSILYPFISGGVNWGSASFDPVRQTLYVLTNNASGFVQLIPRATMPPREELDVFKDGIAAQTGTPYLLKRTLLASPLGLPCNPPPWGQIHAIDMTTGAVKWERPIGTLKDFVPFGDLWLPHGSGNMGGPISTASGLIFVAATMDDYLRALDAETGEELWKGRLPAGGQATPMTYEWRGKQYVVIAAGGHEILGTTRGDSVVAFALERTSSAQMR